jgi:arylsulfatase
LANSQPNILLILADEHRHDCVGIAGNRAVQTPHIDALGRVGTVYSQMYCTFPICTPSRYSILSGLYVRQHRGWHNRSTLSPDIDTFPKILRRAGYRTTAVGKMHLNPTYLDVGFNRMVLAEQAGIGKFDDDYHKWLRRNGQFDVLDCLDQTMEVRDRASATYWESLGTEVSSLPEEYHSTTWIGDRAIEELERWGDDDANLLTVSFIKPHHPFDAPDRWAALYDPVTTDPLPGWTAKCFEHDLVYRDNHHFNPATISDPAIRGATAMYYAMISQIDNQIGRMMAQLEARGMYDNTMVIYTSDHGEYLGFHHLITKGNRMYDPIMRVPCIIKRPEESFTDKLEPPNINDRMFSLIDLFPTILGMASRPVPDHRSGIDMMTHPRGRAAVFGEVYEGREYMVRTGEYKLLSHCDPSQSLLFDLKNDPLELHNRIDDDRYHGHMSDLAKALNRWSLFDALPPPCMGDAGAIIPKVDGKDDYDRVDMERWFQDEIERYLKGQIADN